MRKGEVRVVLPGVVFVDDQIAHQVQQRPCVLTEVLTQHRLEPVLLQNLVKDKMRANFQTATAINFSMLFGYGFHGEVLLVILVGHHHLVITGTHLPDGDSLGHVVAFLGVIHTFKLV